MRAIAPIAALLLAACSAVAVPSALAQTPYAGPLFDRLDTLLPVGVTRQALATQGPNAFNRWWRALPYPPMKRWWMKWPDAVTATGNAQSRLRQDPP